MAGINELCSIGNNLNISLNNLAQTIGDTLPRITGNLTLSNATLSAISQTAILASSLVFWSPTNLSASQTVRARGLYLQSKTAGAGFTLATDNGTAAGTETFSYFIVNLV